MTSAGGPGPGGPVTLTRFEMRAKPPLHVPPPAEQIALIRGHAMPVHYYRYLNATISDAPLWRRRAALDDAALSALIHDEQIEIYVLYVGGVPAGLNELDFRGSPEAELAFFGIAPDYLGRGLGHYLLAQAITLAWGHDIDRLRVAATSADPPQLLPLYQKCGFQAIAQEPLDAT